VIYLIALVLLAGFVAVTLVDRRRKQRRAAPAIQRTDPPADLPADPDPEPDAWPPTR
jgi:hypothetical protein